MSDNVEMVTSDPLADEQQAPIAPPDAPAMLPTNEVPAPSLPNPRKPLSALVLIVLGAGLGLLLGIAVVLTRPAVFVSSGILLFPASSSKVSLLGGSNAGGDLPSIPLLDGAMMVPQPGTSAGTAQVLLQSRRMRESIVLGCGLREHWKLQSDSALHGKYLAQLICKLGKNGELQIGFKDRDAKVARDAAVMLVDELGKLTAELGLDPARRGIGLLERKKQEAQMSLAQKQKELMALQTKFKIVSLPDQVKAAADNFSRIRSDATTAAVEAEIAMQQVALMSRGAERMIKECQDPNATGASDDGPLAVRYKNLIQAQADVLMLGDKYTKDHPEMKEKLRAEKLAKDLLDLEIRRQLGLLKSQNSPTIYNAVIQAAGKRTRAIALQQVLKGADAELKVLPQKEVAYTRLKADVDAGAETVNLYRGELEKAKILADTRGNFFEVLDQPALPSEPEPRQRLSTLLLMTLLGAALGGIPLFLNWLRAQESKEQEITD